MVGELLADRYELEELVGSGGMSSVYRAHDRLLDRKVALKVLHEHYGVDEASVERFRREARAVASVSHPNVVTVIDRGEQDGRQFIVFEYVEGENLKQVLKRSRRLSVEQALELVVQVARGLAYAHQEGIVHRDVKPQNVLVDANGVAKVTDFGIARSLDVQHGMTQTGTVLGTSDYIAPEQAQGLVVDEQSDIYSLGVVLYELLTGEVPFAGENFVAVAMRHINEPPPRVSQSRSDVPPRVDAAIERAMAKRPSDRFRSMDTFAAELDACLSELRGGSGEWTQVIPPPASPRRHQSRRVSPWPAIALIAGLLATGAVVGALVLRHHDNSSGSGGGGGHGGTGAAVHLTAVTANDPYGTNGEHNGAVGLATDGNSSTAWTTEHYRDAPSLGKPGVGLVLDAGSSRVKELTISTSTPGFQATIKGSATTGAGTFTDVSGSETVEDGTTFRLSGGPYRYYEIWITRLGSTDQAAISEVTAKS
jgi:eukaryotic-like serine/threonine-protein kinase